MKTKTPKPKQCKQIKSNPLLSQKMSQNIINTEQLQTALKHNSAEHGLHFPQINEA